MTTFEDSNRALAPIVEAQPIRIPDPDELATLGIEDATATIQAAINLAMQTGRIVEVSATINLS